MSGPILDFQLDLQKKHELIDALQELKMQEEDVAFLEAEYADTLANAGLIKVGTAIRWSCFWVPSLLLLCSLFDCLDILASTCVESRSSYALLKEMRHSGSG